MCRYMQLYTCKFIYNFVIYDFALGWCGNASHAGLVHDYSCVGNVVYAIVRASLFIIL